MVYIKDQAVGEAFLDIPEDRRDGGRGTYVSPSLLPLHLFSLKLSETWEQGLNYQGLILLLDGMGSFRRIGIFELWYGRDAYNKGLTEGSWIWDNVPETQITLI